MSGNYNTNEFGSEVLKDYFREFIKDRAYFKLKTLAIEFLTDNTSLTYKQASSNDNLRGTIMRFSKITTQAKEEEIVKKYNSRVYQIIKKVK